MLFFIFFLMWSFIGAVIGLVLKLVFRILPIKMILFLCIIGYGLHMAGIYLL